MQITYTNWTKDINKKFTETVQVDNKHVKVMLSLTSKSQKSVMKYNTIIIHCIVKM